VRILPITLSLTLSDSYVTVVGTLRNRDFTERAFEKFLKASFTMMVMITIIMITMMVMIMMVMIIITL
jgi:hypothetical protein